MKRLLACGLVVAGITLFAAGCGDDEEAAPAATTAAPAVTTAAPAATTAAPAPAAPADDKVVIGFSNILRTGCAFCVDVEDDVVAAFEAAGYEVFAVDHNLDANQMLANAEAMKARDVDIYLNFDGGITNYEATIETMGDTPMVFIDGPYPAEFKPGLYHFGANGELAGQMCGNWVVDFVNENWGGDIDNIFGVWQSNWPEKEKMRLTECVRIIGEAFPGWSMDTITISDAVLEGEVTEASAAAFINANPDADHLVFITTTNDIAGLAVVDALDSLDRSDHGVIASHGGDSSAVAEIKAGGPFKMSVGYFPDRYGRSLLPIVEGILAGEQVASIHGTPHVYLDITNVNEYYPG